MVKPINDGKILVSKVTKKRFKLTITVQDHPSLHQAKRNETQQTESTEANQLYTEDPMSSLKPNKTGLNTLIDIDAP